MLLAPVALSALAILFWYGTNQNRDNYVAYLISDFVSLRAAEDE